MAEVLVNPDMMTARVKPRVHPKYARKVVQDWLKANTTYKGGWVINITNLYDHDADYYSMELTNPFKMMVSAVEDVMSAIPKHFDRTHFKAVTIGERKFVYCPVGNICSWHPGDYDNSWCPWCKKYFSEINKG